MEDRLKTESIELGAEEIARREELKRLRVYTSYSGYDRRHRVLVNGEEVFKSESHYEVQMFATELKCRLGVIGED